ncbi:MAG: DEAD/DEAH box helicase [Alphaproteobacteria bacterium]
MTMNFESLGLPAKLLQSLNRMKFTTPTPIQAQAIPLALAGRDILGSAQTGTGKTGAFGIPLIVKLMEDPTAGAIVMTPTRELATQVAAMLQQLIPIASIKTALLIGGESLPKQFRQLAVNPQIIVGTPGRINDHLVRGTLKLARTRFLVLDETDRMLDMGFGVQIDKIVAHLPKERQTMLFSATLPPEIVRLSGKYLRQPERIAVGSTITPSAQIKQEMIQLSETEKYPRLLAELEQRSGSIIVFVKTKHGSKRLAEKLNTTAHRADAIHGNLQQNKRDRVIQNFRDKQYRILVATDVAARGLDIPHIEHVINFDLPQCPEDYIHRIGRTARAGAAGSAINLVTPDDHDKWNAIHRLMNPNTKTAPLPRSLSKPKPSNSNKSRGRNRRPFGKSSHRRDGGRHASTGQRSAG